MAQSSKNSVTRRALIITAFPWEEAAVSEHLRDLHEVEEPGGIIYECGTYQGVTSAWEVAVANVGLSKLGAPSQAELAIQFFAPDVALLVGTAFGIEAGLGVVVVAPKVVLFASN